MLSHPRMQVVYGALLTAWAIYLLTHHWVPYTPERFQVLMQLYALPLLIAGCLFWIRFNETSDTRLKGILMLLSVMFLAVAVAPTMYWLGFLKLAQAADPEPVLYMFGLGVLLGGVFVSFVSFFEYPWRR